MSTHRSLPLPSGRRRFPCGAFCTRSLKRSGRSKRRGQAQRLLDRSSGPAWPSRSRGTRWAAQRSRRRLRLWPRSHRLLPPCPRSLASTQLPPVACCRGRRRRHRPIRISVLFPSNGGVNEFAARAVAHKHARAHFSRLSKRGSRCGSEFVELRHEDIVVAA
jgi:hypothetical protein